MAAVDITRAQFYAAFVINSEPTGSVLDVGCGVKPYARLYPECEWTGLDLRPVGDIEADICDYAQGTYDTVLCVDVLHQVTDPFAAIRNMYAMTKPGGRLILGARWLLADDEGDFAFTADGLASLCIAAGYEVDADASVGGLAHRSEADNLWVNHQRLSETPDLSRLLDYFDTRYPCVACVTATKPE